MSVQENLQEKLRKLEGGNSLLLEKLKMARLDGDFSENHDWRILQEKSEYLSQEINLLKKRLNRNEKDSPKRTFFTYCLLETGEKKTIELTSEWESSPEQGQISFTSPLGLALTGKKAGEITEVQVDQKNYKIQILTTE